METLRTERLTKRFGSIQALEDVSLSLDSGKIYALVGNNGSGKTTLFRTIMGLSFPSQGSLSLFGSKTARENELARRRVGAIIEEPILYENISGYQNLNYARVLKGIADKSAIEDGLQKFDLADKSKLAVRHYSIGLKQRLALAGKSARYSRRLVVKMGQQFSYRVIISSSFTGLPQIISSSIKGTSYKR